MLSDRANGLLGTELVKLETTTRKYRLAFAGCCYQVCISCLRICMQMCYLGAVVLLYLFLPNNHVTAILMKREAVMLSQIYARRESRGLSSSVCLLRVCFISPSSLRYWQ